MSDWPLWAQLWAGMSLFTFGLLLGLPDQEIHPVYNVLLSVLLAVLWPIPLVVSLIEVGRYSIRKRD